VALCNKILAWSTEEVLIPLIQLEPDVNYPEVYITKLEMASNVKASLCETKIVGALLASGIFESLFQPFQDTVATCYYFKTIGKLV